MITKAVQLVNYTSFRLADLWARRVFLLRELLQTGLVGLANGKPPKIMRVSAWCGVIKITNKLR